MPKKVTSKWLEKATWLEKAPPKSRTFEYRLVLTARHLADIAALEKGLFMGVQMILESQGFVKYPLETDWQLERQGELT